MRPTHTAFAGQQQLAGGVPVEDGAERDELVDPGRPLVHEDAYRVLVSSPPREAEYACHETCFDRVKHASVPAPV